LTVVVIINPIQTDLVSRMALFKGVVVTLAAQVKEEHY
jgi:hypothetical protein